MKGLLPSQVRPALLSDVRPPGVLLKVGKYAASFLVVGDEADAHVIFLDGDYKFQSFKRSAGTNWSGLAVEDIQFELNLESAFDISGYGKAPGIIVRKEGTLSIVAIPDDAFRRTIQIPILRDLPEASSGQEVAFSDWRAFIAVGKQQCVVWHCSVPVEL